MWEVACSDSQEGKKENPGWLMSELLWMTLLNYIDKTKLLLVNETVCDWVVANWAVLCNRQSLYTCDTLLWFPFCEAFFPLNLCFPPFPRVYFLFVHLLKIKAWSTVRGSFDCVRAEKQPVSISKHRSVCSGLCVLCLFFPFYPPDLSSALQGQHEAMKIFPCTNHF